MKSVFYMLGGLFLAALAGLNFDQWAESHRAFNMVVASIDVALALWWLMLGITYDE